MKRVSESRGKDAGFEVIEKKFLQTEKVSQLRQFSQLGKTDTKTYQTDLSNKCRAEFSKYFHLVKGIGEVNNYLVSKATSNLTLIYLIRDFS